MFPTPARGQAGDAVAGADDPVDRRVVFEGDAALHAELRQPVGEHLAIAGFVARQPEPADELLAHRRQRRLGRDAAIRIESLIGHAIFLQHLDVAGDAVELLLAAKQLQRTFRALVIGDAGRLA